MRISILNGVGFCGAPDIAITHFGMFDSDFAAVLRLTLEREGNVIICARDQRRGWLKSAIDLKACGAIISVCDRRRLVGKSRQVVLLLKPPRVGPHMAIEGFMALVSSSRLATNLVHVVPPGTHWIRAGPHNPRPGE
jgi:hypothetical protein